MPGKWLNVMRLSRADGWGGAVLIEARGGEGLDRIEGFFRRRVSNGVGRVAEELPGLAVIQDAGSRTDESADVADLFQRVRVDLSVAQNELEPDGSAIQCRQSLPSCP